MNRLGLYFLIGFFSVAGRAQLNDSTKADLNNFIDAWHLAAANAQFASYFNKMHKEAIFIGTQADEIWNKEAFMRYAAPHFRAGKAWHFKAFKREITANENTYWFHELLKTPMGVCRGSGVIINSDDGFLIKQYVLSYTIPNALGKQVVLFKKEKDSIFLKENFKKPVTNLETNN
ncbi:nuclear transport factor 2 family protein [uncultured Mesonia sp.]|uniref:nuclear transport factor 2 family protein n=1 Tax=uncultured Mesonia sp. TaxID=399731 RepID=UPI00374F826F